GGAGELRPFEGELRQAAGDLLAEPRPDGQGPAVLRRRLAVPPGDLLSLRGSEAARRSVKGKMGEGEALPPADPHADYAGERVLSGRGLPPGLLQEEPGAVPVLRHRVRALRAPRPALGSAKEALITAASSGCAEPDLPL